MDEQVDNLGASLVFAFMATQLGSVFFACILWFSISDADTALIAGFVGLVIFWTIGTVLCGFLMKKKMNEFAGLWTWKSITYDLLLRNVMDLREDLSGVVGYIPAVWPILIKFFIPPILLILFFLGCAAKTSTGQSQFGHYSGYAAIPFQLIGILTVAFTLFLILSSVAMPQIYAAFKKQDSPVADKEDTIHGVTPEMTTDEDGKTSMSLTANPNSNVWPPSQHNSSNEGGSQRGKSEPEQAAAEVFA